MIKNSSNNVYTLSSFITNFGIKTEITNELATTVTVGAQANGAVKGQDSTSFSKWNSGITDRILPIKSTTNPTGSSATTSEDTTTGDINVEYQNQISEYSSWVSGFKKEDDIMYDEQVDYFSDVLKNILEYNQSKQSEETQKVSPTSTGFIPINLNLEMIGLSGMKIYQKFSINQNFLPLNYDSTLEFLIKGISHKIDNKGWFTIIEALSVPSSTSSGANPDLAYTKPPLNTTETSSGGSGAAGGAAARARHRRHASAGGCSRRSRSAAARSHCSS